MRRKYLFLGLIAAVAATAAVVWKLSPSRAEAADPEKGPVSKTNGKTLPLSQVVLFSSGVGFFQREGSVEGDTLLELAFPLTDVNDLLKSMVFHDLGNGRISGVSYDSQEPIERTLKTFALDLTTNPSFGQLLNQARGEKVEVVVQQTNAAQPATMNGVIIGMESSVEQGKEVHQLNLLCTEGVRCVPLPQVQRMRFLNVTLDGEFRRALEVLSAAHNNQKRGVSLNLTGEGNRQVRLGYVVESPIWKPTYRLVLDKQGKPSLQGWAVVENTTDEDWKDVRTTLVSSRPISFEMDLYQPLFVPRPRVEPDLFASLRPPTYQGAIATAPQQQPEAPKGGQFNFGGNFGGQFNFGGNFGGQFGGNNGGYGNNGGQFNFGGSFSGFNGFMPGSATGNRYQTEGWNNVAQSRLTFEELQKRRQEKQEAMAEAKKVGSAVAAPDPHAVEATVKLAEEIGDYCQYNIEQKVNLPRQKSALLPIVEQKVEGTQVSIFNESVHPKFPLSGLRFKNTTGQNLMQGPVSVFEGGTYAGDARLTDLQPDEERLLSYAIDLGVEVKATGRLNVGPKMTAQVVQDSVTVRYTVRQTRTYQIRNRSKQDRKLIIEHPIGEKWKLVEGMKPYEKSRDVYRFEVDAPAGKTVNFEVAEEQGRDDPFVLKAKPVEADRQTLISPIRLGLEVELVNRQIPAELLGVKIAKGKYYTTLTIKEERTYRLRNHSDQEREFVVEHHVRPDWKLLGDAKPIEGTTNLYGFPLKVAAGKTGEQEVVEQTTTTTFAALSSLTDEQLAWYQANPAVSAKVKTALKQIAERQAKMAEASKAAAEWGQRLKTITDDQARLRANIDKVPRESAAYKRYLEKFDAQETEIEKLQPKIDEAQKQQQQLRKEYDEFLAGLSAE
jgi:hypothetical protein